jgi:hypothetical protein
MAKRTIAAIAAPQFLQSNMVEVNLPSHKQQRNRCSTMDQLRSCYHQYSSLVILIVLLAFFLLLDWPEHTKHALGIQKNPSSTVVTNVVPSHQVIDGIDVLWAASSRSDPCGILFVAHGCNHAHTDWFVCQQGCLGLPEEVAIVNLALERNLVVVAVSSKNRHSKCWNPEVDGPRVATVLQKIPDKYAPVSSSPLPIWAFGASSGGGFVSALGNFMKIQGYLSQIMARQTPEGQSLSEACMVHLTMQRDLMTRDMAEQIVSQVPSSSNNARHIRLPPLAISSADFFSKRIGSVSSSNSKSTVQSLQQGGFLDAQGYLKQDPRGSDWRSAVQPFAESDTLLANQSAISEIMNVAYSMHEMSREGVAEGLDFCLSLLPPSSSTCR